MKENQLPIEEIINDLKTEVCNIHNPKTDLCLTYEAIANIIFNRCKLRVNKICYRIIEIEFYKHGDNFIHGREQQMELFNWYFHESGIDITLGNGEKTASFLIRGIAKMPENINVQPPNRGDEIHGPIKVMMKICSGFNSVFDPNGNAFRLESYLHDDSKLGLKCPLVFNAERVGLKESNNPGEAKMKYRFLHLGYIKTLPGKEAVAVELQKENKINKDKRKIIL